MISPKTLYETLEAAGVTFVAGVPDSLLKEFCAYADAVLPPEKHLITANEGSAVAVAAGVHLATGGIPLIYLQNSGLGNTINPLLSLADPAVYGIPMILLIGWRGEPGVPDEPQHVKQGQVTLAMLESMDIPYFILDGDPAIAVELAKTSVAKANERSGPVVLVARRDAFDKAESRRSVTIRTYPVRERAIELITSALPPTTTVIATTGHISRELYEQRVRHKQDRARDFLTVGSMGHASQIALGIHLVRPNETVVCLDGDGAALMHLGGMATIGAMKPANYLHIIINNGAHDSVGGQPTVGFDVAFPEIAKACGYRYVSKPVETEEEIQHAIQASLQAAGPRLVEVRVRPGARKDLGRPKESPAENKALLTAALQR